LMHEHAEPRPAWSLAKCDVPCALSCPLLDVAFGSEFLSLPIARRAEEECCWTPQALTPVTPSDAPCSTWRTRRCPYAPKKPGPIDVGDASPCTALTAPANYWPTPGNSVANTPLAQWSGLATPISGFCLSPPGSGLVTPINSKVVRAGYVDAGTTAGVSSEALAFAVASAKVDVSITADRFSMDTVFEDNDQSSFHCQTSPTRLSSIVAMKSVQG